MTSLLSMLSYSQTYSCPLCLRGEIQSLPLMDAFACGFCRHIFSANLEEQVLNLADGQVPRRWYRRNDQWIATERRSLLAYGLFGVALIILPTAIVSLGAYCFPPLPNSPLSWLPQVWIGLTLLSHASFLAWLTVAYFQFPIGSYMRLLRERFMI